MALISGSMLENRYKIIAPLGEGGFGTVYHALDTRLNAEYAVKELTQTGQEAVEQFRIEAEMMARLKHPGLPSVTDYFSEGGNNYLVMEYVPGLDLAQWLHQNGPVPEKQMLTWTTHILDALNYLHTQSPPIIHRDIKPSNIKIGHNNRAILVDFGIAKVWVQGGKTTGTAQAVSPPYSPLEQYSSGQGKTGPRSDIYALGATLYLLFSGRHPPDPIQRSTKEQPLLPLRRLNAGVSPGVEKVVLKAMALKREDRWQSAHQMWEAIARAASQSQPVVKPARATGSFLSRISNVETVLISAIVLVVVAILAVIAGFNITSNKTIPAPTATIVKQIAASTSTRTPPTATRVSTQETNAGGASSPTQTPSPSPTSTPTPKKKNTGSISNSGSTPPASSPTFAPFTPAPTSSPTPSPRPTSTPTLTPVPPTQPPPPKPTPTATPIAPSAPVLISPANNDSVSGLVTFVWDWTGAPLDANQGFEVRVWKEGQDHYGAAGPGQAASQAIDLNGAYGVQLGGGGDYFWTVALVQLDPYQRLGEEAVPRSIHIGVGGDGGDDGGGDSGGGGKPTPAP